MPSPDFSNYIDLTLYDLSSQQIFLDAVEYARLALPEFEPVEGSIETVLLEAMALEVQQLATTINRLPNGILHALLNLLNVSRRDASPSTGVVRLTAAVSGDATVPAGTRLYSSIGANTESLVVLTDDVCVMSTSKYLSTLSRTGTTVTASTLVRHGLSDTDTITVTTTAQGGAASGAAGSSFGVDSVIDDYTFTYTTVSTGSISEVDLSDTGSYITVTSATAPYALIGVTASSAGYSYLAAGTTLQVLTAIRQVGTAVLHSDLDGGYNAETDSAFFTRSSATLGRMTSALVTPEQVVSFIATEPALQFAYRVAAVDGVTDQRVDGQAGVILIYAAPIGADVDNYLSESQLLEIFASVNPFAHQALEIDVTPFGLAKISVTADVVARDGFTSAEVESAINTSLSEYFNPDTWDLSSTIHNSEVASVIYNATHNGKQCVRTVSNIVLAVTGNNNDAFDFLSPYVPTHTDDQDGSMGASIEFDDYKMLFTFDSIGSSITVI